MAKEQALSKQGRIIESEILSEKINLERCRFEELEQNRRVKHLEDERDSLQSVLLY